MEIKHVAQEGDLVVVTWHMTVAEYLQLVEDAELEVNANVEVEDNTE